MPSWLETVFEGTFVSTLVAVTSVPATSAPVVSVTVPVIMARLACPAEDVAARTIISVTKRNRLQNLTLDMLPPVICESDSCHFYPALHGHALTTACARGLRLLQLNLNQSYRSRCRVDPVPIGLRTRDFFIRRVEQRERILPLRNQSKGRPNLARPHSLAFLDQQMLAGRPVNTVGRKCVANCIPFVRVVDGDIGSVLQFGDNRILDEPLLDSQRIPVRAANPRSGETRSFRQPYLPQRYGKFFGMSAAIQRKPLIANFIGKERIRSL